jgi:uncharacterized protein (TIGR02594 family)
MAVDGARIPPVLPREQKPVWLVLAEAELGVREFPGGKTNPRIAEFYTATSLGGKPEDSATPWCAAFVSWVLEKSGYLSTRKANARSYLHFGEEVTGDPKPGDIVVMWRTDPHAATGHVGFFYALHGEHQLWVLGGNQNNEVGLALYGRGRVLGFRRPRESDRK